MKDFTVQDAINWSDKHRQLTGEGVRVVHIKQLLTSERERGAELQDEAFHNGYGEGLKAERERVIEVVEGMKEPEPVEFELAKLRNETLDDIITKLKDQK